MNCAKRRFAVLALLAVLVGGCSSAPASFGEVEVSEGIAVCRFPTSQVPFKLGEVDDEGHVRMYRTYGGGKLALGDVKRIVSTIGEEAAPTGKDAAHALKQAFNDAR